MADEKEANGVETFMRCLYLVVSMFALSFAIHVAHEWVHKTDARLDAIEISIKANDAEADEE